MFQFVRGHLSGPQDTIITTSFKTVIVTLFTRVLTGKKSTVIRDDCGYSFSDRSRLIQHTLRHERIDSLTGGEMQQYRMNQDCHRAECEYQGKASHFHCLKCDYSCTDSSKVLTHRKNHAKSSLAQ
jgi:hypothetical protein